VLPGVVLWQRDGRPEATVGRILPDGCMDLIWDGTRLVVAGPDTRARWHATTPGQSFVGLRFSRGIGPGVLGFPADELRDLSADLDDLWPAADVRRLEDEVAGAPVEALERWLARRVADDAPPTFGAAELGAAVFELSAGGATVGAMADRLGYSVRQLHRRCLPLFGYGPQHLVRVLRLNRALDAARSGLSLAEVSAQTGFADQAHLSRDVRVLVGTSPARLLRDLTG